MVEVKRYKRKSFIFYITSQRIYVKYNYTFAYLTHFDYTPLTKAERQDVAFLVIKRKITNFSSFNDYIFSKYRLVTAKEKGVR